MQNTDTITANVVLKNGMLDTYRITKWDILTTPSDNLLQLETKSEIIIIPIREIVSLYFVGRSVKDVKEHISFQPNTGSSVFKRFTSWLKSE